MKLYVVPLLLVTLIGCNKSRGTERLVHTIHEYEIVSLVDLPSNSVAYGNIDFTPVLFNVTFINPQVYVKKSDDTLWEIYTDFVYDAEFKQLRFHNVQKGWGYAVKNNIP